MEKVVRRGYLTDVSDEELSFVLPYLLLSRSDNASREHDLRAIFNAVRYVVKGGNQWRLIPNDLPPWPAAYQQMRRWMRAGCFERIVEDVQPLLRQFGGRKGQPTEPRATTTIYGRRPHHLKRAFESKLKYPRSTTGTQGGDAAERLIVDITIGNTKGRAVQRIESLDA